MRKRYEQDAGVFIVEGERALLRVLEAGWDFESVLLSESKRRLREAVEGMSAAPIMVAAGDVMERVTGFHVHRGVLAVARRPPPLDAVRLAASTTLVVVVEGVSDHENMGALFRNAAAFGAGGVLLDPTCCDPLYRRSVRVSLGHVVGVPYATLSPWPGGLNDIDGYTVLALSPSGATSLEEAARWCAANAPKVALMVGAEGRGLSGAALGAADRQVRIPMAEGVDSLNVATATAVALGRLRPRGSAPLV